MRDKNGQKGAERILMDSEKGRRKQTGRTQEADRKPIRTAPSGKKSHFCLAFLPFSARSFLPVLSRSFSRLLGVLALG